MDLEVGRSFVRDGRVGGSRLLVTRLGRIRRMPSCAGACAGGSCVVRRASCSPCSPCSSCSSCSCVCVCRGSCSLCSWFVVLVCSSWVGLAVLGLLWVSAGMSRLTPRPCTTIGLAVGVRDPAARRVLVVVRCKKRFGEIRICAFPLHRPPTNPHAMAENELAFNIGKSTIIHRPAADVTLRIHSICSCGCARQRCRCIGRIRVFHARLVRRLTFSSEVLHPGHSMISFMPTAR